MDWFLYDRDLRHERINTFLNNISTFALKYASFVSNCFVQKRFLSTQERFGVLDENFTQHFVNGTYKI